MQKKKTASPVLLGEPVQVHRAKNPCLEGMSGTITDETRNTIRIKTKQGEKTLIKDQITIIAGGRKIDGKRLKGRVEERIKNKRR